MMFMFPGQGSQYVGMGKLMYDNFHVAKDIFHEIDDVLGFSLSKIIFHGPHDELILTENAQPALVATAIAALNVFLDETKSKITDFAQYVCGHSLGEYTAVCAAGGISFADTISLVRMRGLAMKEASKNIDGGMLAVIKSDIKTVQSIIDKIDGFCEIANDNSDDQIVISGSSTALEDFVALAKQHGVKKTVKLPVNAPFHSTIMNDVGKIMREKLDNIALKKLVLPLISNVNVLPVSDVEDIKDVLVKQINNKVRWREIILFAKENSVNSYVEFGPGKVLTNLVKKINENSVIYNVHEVSEIEHLVKSFLPIV